MGYSSASSPARSDIGLAAEEIASFLLSQQYLRSLIIQAALKEKRSDIRVRLSPPLKRYGQDLVKMASGTIHSMAAREFIRHAPYIAEVILRESSETSQDKDPIVTKMRQARIETLPQSHRGDSSSTSASAIGLEGDQELSRPHLSFPKPALEEMKDFMKSNVDALSSFLAFARRIVYSDPLEAVEDEVSRNIEDITGRFSATYHVHWELGSYIEKEINVSIDAQKARETISSLLVLCGSLESGYAESCWVYMKWKWPDLTEPVFEAIQKGSSHGEGK